MILNMEKPEIVLELKWSNLLRGESPVEGGDLIFRGEWGYADPDGCIRHPPIDFFPWRDNEVPIPGGESVFETFADIA